MASSRKPKRRRNARSLAAHVADCLKKVVEPGQRLMLGLSGGVDSIVLLDVLARIARRLRFVLSAVHVNHQLSPNAASWARFCRRACRARGVSCRVVTVSVERGNSIEGAARDARYRAFAAARADYVVLAHNRDDQAETVLLQLLRGTGVKGLAGMRAARDLRETRALVLRPLLDVPRVEIQRYAERHKLEWIHDESNVDTNYTRNWIRHEVLPRIAERLPHYRESLVRAAGNMREAGELLDDLAAIDFAAAEAAGALRVDVLRGLSGARVRNVLRFAIDRHGWTMPDSSRLAEAARQALGARRDRQVVVNLGSCELRRHGELLHLLGRGSSLEEDAQRTWQGERRIDLPYGVLTMTRARGAGMSAARLAAAAVTIRQRSGGERLQLAANRPRRTLKNLLQEARVAPWERERLPLIFCGDALVCVPGIGVEWGFQAGAKEPSVVASWLPGALVSNARARRMVDPD
jgi:tRNA(Ile)-lysidine synthase